MTETNDYLTITNGIVTKCNKNAINVIIPDDVTKIASNAFDGCKKIKSVIIPDSVTEVGSYAFSGCEKLTNVEFGSSLKMIREAAFKDSGLTSVKLPEGISKIARWVFYGAKALKEIEIPRSIKEIGDNAFYDCEALEKIVFAGSIKEWEEIKGKANLLDSVPAKDIICSDGIAVRPVLTIEEGILIKCLDKSIKSIEIPDGVTKIKTKAFFECKKLNKIFIPKSIKEIEYHAFEDCTALKYFTFAGTRKEWEKVQTAGHWKYNVPAKTIKCKDDGRAYHGKYALDLGDWTLEDALSCIQIENTYAEKWRLEYCGHKTCRETNWEEQSNSEFIGYFDTKESAIHYFFDHKLYKRVLADYVKCLSDECKCTKDSSLDDLREEFFTSESGKPYCNFGYFLSKADLRPVVSPNESDERFLEANGIDLSAFNEDYEDEEHANDYEEEMTEEEQEMHDIEMDAYAEAYSGYLGE